MAQAVEDQEKKKAPKAPSENAPAGFQPKKRTSSKKSPSSEQAKSTEEVKAAHNPDELIGLPCPVCKQGHIIKGRTAYGCSRWNEGCTYRLPFDQA